MKTGANFLKSRNGGLVIFMKKGVSTVVEPDAARSLEARYLSFFGDLI